MTRDIDWKAYVNRLVYCYGCGRFGMPRKGGKPPMRWKILYQPHADAPPGLHVCSETCADEVRDAMSKGPVREPLKVGTAPMMDAELRHQMMEQLRRETEERIRKEQRFVFDCAGCGCSLNPLSSNGIPTFFTCPRCNQPYRAEAGGLPGEVRFEPIPKKEIP